MTASSGLKGNMLAMERIKELERREQLEKMNTKQKRGTPTVRELLHMASVDVSDFQSRNIF